MARDVLGSGSMKLTAFGLTDRGRKRSRNEDDLGIVDLSTGKGIDPAALEDLPIGDLGVLLAVCDGVGGRRAGEVASALALSSLAEEMEEQAKSCPRRAMFGAAVEHVNRTVWEKAHEDPRLEGMATTLTAAVVCRNRAILAHVGDSRAYVFRRGAIRQVTRDQSFVQSLVTSGALSEEEAKQSPYRNVILQAIGRKKQVEVALDAVELEEGDTLLLCTDGLSEKVAAPELARALENPDLQSCVRGLIDLANERGGEDNITALVAR
ncbi:MAG TPA: Stp1/IreP family PP2C-type Ser/Thr phosphatase, partial [Thermoanaerobaculia bacterium]|nr:Stp1/IreP family PP2C-type Ser/Thr phosphatase [Thermoanaerobaculia bacterium]